MGVQASMWTEFCNSPDDVEYQLFPRLWALSDIAWAKKGTKDWPDFLKRIDKILPHIEAMDITCARSMYNIQHTSTPVDGALQIKLECIRPDVEIRYTTDGSEPEATSTLYTRPLEFHTAQTLKCATFAAGRQMGKTLVLPLLHNKATAKPLILLQPINEKYKYNGEYTLVDGLSGTPNYRTGRWIAFYKNDMELVVDLKQETSVHKAWVRTYVEIGEEILDVRSISVLSSADGKIYKELKTVDYPAVTSKDNNGIYKHEVDFDTVSARYIKIIAKQEYKIPSWHAESES